MTKDGNRLVTCPCCKGKRGFMSNPHLIYSSCWHVCRICEGTGTVPPSMLKQFTAEVEP